MTTPNSEDHPMTPPTPSPENILLHLTQVIESLSVNTKELAGANHQALQALATRFSHLPQTGETFEGLKPPNPRFFSAEKESYKVEEFVRQLDNYVQYFANRRAFKDEAEKIRICSAFLEGRIARGSQRSGTSTMSQF
jgi:hypothetical protein